MTVQNPRKHRTREVCSSFLWSSTKGSQGRRETRQETWSKSHLPCRHAEIAKVEAAEPRQSSLHPAQQRSSWLSQGDKSMKQTLFRYKAKAHLLPEVGQETWLSQDCREPHPRGLGTQILPKPKNEVEKLSNLSTPNKASPGYQETHTQTHRLQKSIPHVDTHRTP